MNNLTMNHEASDDLANRDADGQGAESNRQYAVPLRPGSKYTDILLQRLQSEVFKKDKPYVIGVVSPLARQGATTTAVNLAIRAADHSNSPTLIIDGNFHVQKVSRMYRTSGAGLSECLTGRAKLDDCAKATKIENLSVLGLGQAKIARQLVVTTDPMIDFLKELRESYRLSIIDLPSMSEPNLADALFPHLDGVLMVAKYGTSKEKLRMLQQNVRDSGGEIVGSVMTGRESKLPSWLARFF